MKSYVRRFVSLSSLILLASLTATAGNNADPDPTFDRLDGKGESGKKVDVIEWEGNLEVHVTPAGSLKGLALKIDDHTGQKVMVIGYRFDNDPKKQLIRRAILGIDLHAPFKTFRDPSETEFDKIVISNNTLSGEMAAYKLDPEPTQLYPDGHPALAKKDDAKSGRSPASAEPQQEGYAVQKMRGLDEDTGAITPFFMEGGKRRPSGRPAD